MGTAVYGEASAMGRHEAGRQGQAQSRAFVGFFLLAHLAEPRHGRLDLVFRHNRSLIPAGEFNSAERGFTDIMDNRGSG